MEKNEMSSILYKNSFFIFQYVINFDLKKRLKNILFIHGQNAHSSIKRITTAQFLTYTQDIKIILT